MSGRKRKPIEIGDVVAGKYRVDRVLGEGGMGMVVHARHRDLGHSVAIKVLSVRDDEEKVARFILEARAAARLNGEHVAKVTDFGRLPDGTPYMVMEFLEGEDLAALTARGPLPIAHAVALLLQACEGIAEAHSLGIVHRDLKLQNLFLTRTASGSPLVKVLDFGLAKTRDASGAHHALTAALTVVGSPPYMSPEQVRADRDIDARTDIWSLGVCLYELLTCRLPFESQTVQEICARVLKDPPTPIQHVLPSVPEGLRRVLARCLAKQAAARYRTVWEVAVALEPYAHPSAAGAAARVKALLFSHTPGALHIDVPDIRINAMGVRVSGVETNPALRWGRGLARRGQQVARRVGLAAAILVALWVVVKVAQSKAAPGATSAQPAAADNRPADTAALPPVGREGTSALSRAPSTEIQPASAAVDPEAADAGSASLLAPRELVPGRSRGDPNARRRPPPRKTLHPESTRM